MSSVSSRILFPYFFDPRQGCKSLDILLLAKLHFLLFDAITIQDNFLVSKLLADARPHRAERSPFCDWIERGWIKVSLREGAYSLSDLKDQLLTKALNADYIPFEETKRGVQLYRSKVFNSYLQEIDACLCTEGAVLAWDQHELGKRLRDLMKSSAEDGSSGLSESRALAIWDEVDHRAFEGIHTRSLYYQCAESLSDPLEAQLVRNWVGFKYLTNLPDALSLGLSIPRTGLTAVGGSDPIQEIADTESMSDSSITRGRDCLLLNGTFLQALEVTDIERIRRLNEFKDLVDARSGGKPEVLKKSLMHYLKALGEEGPRITDPRIRTLEAQVSLKRVLGPATAVLGVLVMLMNPALGSALTISGIFLNATSGTEKQIQKANKKVLIDLEMRRTSVVDFCHDRMGKTKR